MKNLRFRTVYLLFLLFFSFGWMIEKSEAQKNDWQKENLKGRIKMIKDKVFYITDSLNEEQKFKTMGSSEIKYNKNGFRVEEIGTHSSKKVDYKNTYKYYKNGCTFEEDDYS